MCILAEGLRGPNLEMDFPLDNEVVAQGPIQVVIELVIQVLPVLELELDAWSGRS